jgi:hypothetical protein
VNDKAVTPRGLIALFVRSPMSVIRVAGQGMMVSFAAQIAPYLAAHWGCEVILLTEYAPTERMWRGARRRTNRGSACRIVALHLAPPLQHPGIVGHQCRVMRDCRDEDEAVGRIAVKVRKFDREQCNVPGHRLLHLIDERGIDDRRSPVMPTRSPRRA